MTRPTLAHPIVLAITGASGVVYGQRLLEVLLALDQPVHLTISESGRQVLLHELGVEVDLANFQPSQLFPNVKPAKGRLVYHRFDNFMAPIASGSFRTQAMVICPCSGSTLSGIATAASGNLIQRAADVHLKERRPLILVPRETPLSLTQIENMRTVTLAGATVLPASPGFYHGCDKIENLIDFVVARILDQLQVEHQLMRRWGEQE
jgi:4-hydroxy-3-polyprenylbenzoate decarboxylase